MTDLYPDIFQGTDGALYVGRRLERSGATSSSKPTRSTIAKPSAPKPRSFGDRLRSILDLPEARERRRQAVALVLETSMSPAEARATLATLPTDSAAQFPHGGSLFPEAVKKLDNEHVRLAAILRCAEAEGREAAAIELATQTSLPAEQIAALLARMPKASASRIPTIEERAMEMPEFGNEPMPRAARSRGGEAWSSVIDKMNNGASK